MPLFIMWVVFVLALFSAWRAFKRHGFTAFNLFFIGCIVIYALGFIGTYMFPEKAYCVQGDPTRLDILIWNLVIFWAIVFTFVEMQKGKGALPSGEILARSARDIPWKPFMLLAMAYSILVLLGIDWGAAPLMNIGKFNHRQMIDARNAMYNTPLLSWSGVPRYVVYYALVPFLFLSKGLGARVPWVLLLFMLFVGILSLAKTFFLLAVVFYFSGRILRNRRLRDFLYFLATAPTGIYLIVRAGYSETEARGFWAILGFMAARVVQVPIDLSALYAHTFRFSEGLRSSSWYTLIFGGNQASLPIYAFTILNPVQSGNAPTGIVGSSYPNVPWFLHAIYFLGFIAYIFYISEYILSLRKPLLKIVLSVVFGFGSWFILLTDPFTAMNSFGLLYIGGLAVGTGILARMHHQRMALEKLAKAPHPMDSMHV